MKSHKISFSILALLFGSVLLSVSCYAQRHIKGNGNIQTQSRKAGHFTQINSAGTFHVFLTQGNSTGIKIKADENLLPYIITEVHGNTLDLKTKKHVSINPTKSVEVYLTVNNLEEIKVSGVCMIQSQNTLQADHLNIEVSGTGNIDLKIKATALHTAISGTGKANLMGSSKEAEYRISGTADVKAGSLVTNNTDIAISGVGKVHVNAQQKLDVSVSGSGKVWYKGSPEISQQVSGAGTLMKE